MSEKLSLFTSLQVNKKAKDGTGIQSTQVVFCVAGSGVTPTAASTWVESISELTLSANTYIWSATKTVLTDGTVSYTGIYKMGASEDFVSVTVQYYLSKFSTRPPASIDNWSTTYTPTEEYYLWTRNAYTWTNGTVTYANIRCISYFAKNGTNGTSFTMQGKAIAHYANYTAYKASGNTEKGDILIDNNKNDDSSYSSLSLPSTPYVLSFDSNGNECYDKASNGDAYTVDTELYVSNGTIWADVGKIAGADGLPGKDALNVVVSKQTLQFAWIQGKGYSNAPSGLSVQIYVYKGATSLSTDEYEVTKGEVSNFSGASTNIAASSDKGHYSVTLYPADIAMNEYTYQNLTDTSQSAAIKYPKSSATAVFQIKEISTGMIAKITITINVDFRELYGNVVWDKESLSSVFGRVQSAEGRIEKSESRIEQNADAINARVTQDEYNDEMKIIHSDISGCVLKSDYAGLFSQCLKADGTVMKKADMGVYVTKDDDGNIESGAKINADNININANHNLNISGNYLNIDTTNFKVDTSGNVSMTGEITANSIKLKVSPSDNVLGGSLLRCGIYTMPELEDGVYVNLKLVAPILTRVGVSSVLNPASDNVFFCNASSDNTSSMAKSETVTLYGSVYDLIGFGENGKTYWMIK